MLTYYQSWHAERNGSSNASLQVASAVVILHGQVRHRLVQARLCNSKRYQQQSSILYYSLMDRETPKRGTMPPTKLMPAEAVAMKDGSRFDDGNLKTGSCQVLC